MAAPAGAVSSWIDRIVAPLTLILAGLFVILGAPIALSTTVEFDGHSVRLAGTTPGSAVCLTVRAGVGSGSCPDIQNTLHPLAAEWSRSPTTPGIAAKAGPGPIAFGPAPENAWSTFTRVESKGSPLPGHKGGSGFANDGRDGGQILPRQTPGGDSITYREWDVNPNVKGVDRGLERIVTGNDGSAYYTDDHYKWFTQFWGSGG